MIRNTAKLADKYCWLLRKLSLMCCYRDHALSGHQSKVPKYLLNLKESFNGTFVLNRDMMTSYITRQSNLFYEKKCLTHFASSLPHIWNKWKNTLDMSMTRSQIKVNVSLCQFQKYSDRVTCQNIRCKDCHGDK